MTTSESPSENHRTSNNAGICLGHKSALEVARGISPSHLLPTKAQRRKLPCQAPLKKNVEAALLHIEENYPGLYLTRPVHVLVGSNAQCEPSNICISHSCQIELSDGALNRFEVTGFDTVLVCSPSFAFTQIAAQEKNFLELLQLGFEICGTYQTGRTNVAPAYQVSSLTSVSALRDFVTRNPSIRGAKKVRKALPYLADGSASPRETKLALLLGLPMPYGGYGLGMPHMNYKVEADAGARAITGKSYLLCDLCWPEIKLDVEYQSHEMHANEISRINDSRRANALASMGWKTIGITNDELGSERATETIADTIRKLLGKRQRTTVTDYAVRKFNLRKRLGLAVDYE